MEQLTETTVQSLLDLGASLMGVRGLTDGGKPFVIVPQGYKVEDIEKLLPRPVTKRAEVTLTEADSFIFYTKKHGSLDECVIYADVDYAAYSCRLIVFDPTNVDGVVWDDLLRLTVVSLCTVPAP